MKKAAIAIVLALAMSSFNGLAQDPGGSPPGEGGQGGGPKHKPGGIHLLPPRAEEKLNLTADQKKQLADLEAEVKAKIEKILTPEQMEQLKQMRPPRPPVGPGGGPKGRDGDAGQPKPEPPPSE
jgi:Spy/CpxP family protein refolding chaperone